MPKKPFNLKARLISKAREIHRYWPEREKAFQMAFTNGRGYQCADCKEHFLSRKAVQADHPETFIPLTGFDSWDAAYNRLFITAEKYDILCKPCHREKTNRENRIRKHLAEAQGKKMPK